MILWPYGFWKLLTTKGPPAKGNPERAFIPVAVRLGGLSLLAVCAVAMLMMTLQHFAGLELPGCGPKSSCSELQASPWGNIAGWPVSFLGLAYFTALAVTWISMDRRGVGTAFRYIVRLGALVSVGFVLLMVRERQICIYCLVTHAAHVVFWLLLEWTPRLAGFALKTTLPFVMVFALVSAILNVVESDRKRTLAEIAARQLQESIQKILVVSRAEEEGALQGDSGKNPGRSEGQTLPSEQRNTALSRVPEEASGSPSGRPENQRLYRLGPKQARIRLLLFINYQCGRCVRVHQQLQELLKLYAPFMSIEVKHYPLCKDCNPYYKAEDNPNGCRAARAVEAAGILKGNEGFWRMHSWVFEHEGTFSDKELTDGLLDLGFGSPAKFLETMNGLEVDRRIQAQIAEAEAWKIEATPLIFINGVRLEGTAAENALVLAVRTLVENLPEAPIGSTNPLPSNPLVDSPYFSKEMQENALRATVRIVNAAQDKRGSGVVIGRSPPFSYILTANHVVDQADRLEIFSRTEDSSPEPEKLYQSGQVIAQIDRPGSGGHSLDDF